MGSANSIITNLFRGSEDINDKNYHDRKSLKTEASMVTRSVHLNQFNTMVLQGDNTLMDIDSCSEDLSNDTEGDFDETESDVDSDHSSDPTYVVSESDLARLSDGYDSYSDSSDLYSSDSVDRPFQYRQVYCDIINHKSCVGSNGHNE